MAVLRRWFPDSIKPLASVFGEMDFRFIFV